MIKPYGKELILDLHDCDTSKFTREAITEYMEGLCSLIKMERCDLHFWDDVGVPEGDRQTSPQTKGTSAVQFILTSNITIHTLDELGKVFINIFSCKWFDPIDATIFSRKYFGGSVVTEEVVKRL